MIIKLVILAVCTSLLSLLVKEDFKTGAVLISLAGCIIIFTQTADIISKTAASFSQLKKISGVNGDGARLIIKMLAVAYATSFGADICAETGAKAVGSALESVGKLVMLAMALPMLAKIFQSVTDMLG